jgi:hypothetical protein
MGIEIPLFQGLSLSISDPPSNKQAYSTASLQKGFLIMDQGQELAEEAVGFGVPVLKRGIQTIFPGSAALTWMRHATIWNITARFRLNRIEKFSRPGNSALENRLLYSAKDALAAAIRSLPILRAPLTALSSLLRRSFHLETIYAQAGFTTELQVLYTVDTQTGKVSIDIDTGDLPLGITEVMLMNEQGARAFDRYQDTSGLSLQGRAIGCWDEVTAPAAWFESRTHQVAFRLGQVNGAQLFRGREQVGSRLAWAGFGYSFSPSIHRFHYELKIEKRP